MSSETKLGLVLSGGGAKGAYQVGILKYMAEIGLQPDMVSGTSIGALNGAVLSATKDISQSYRILEKVWKDLADNSPVKLDSKQLLQVASIFLCLIPQARLNPLFLAIREIVLRGKVLEEVTHFGMDIYAKFSKEFENSDRYKRRLESSDKGLLRDGPLIDLLDEYASIEEIKSGLPYYIGVYESDGSFKDAVTYIKQSLLGAESKNSDFWHVQSLSDKSIHDAIMASAALPFLFQTRAVDGKLYRDGGMGDAFTQQGNTPIQPLIENGCTHIVVSLLDDGSSFDRHLYPDTAILEVRPKEFISDSMKDMVAFEPEKIFRWMEQGYQDAKRCIGNVYSAFKVVELKDRSKAKRDAALELLDNDGFEVD